MEHPSLEVSEGHHLWLGSDSCLAVTRKGKMLFEKSGVSCETYFSFFFFFGWGVLLFHKSMNCLFNLSNDENIVAYFCLFCFYLYGRHINNAGLWGMRSGALLESSALQEKSRHPTTRFFTGHSVTWQCTLWCPEVCFIEMFRDIIFQ